MPELPLFDALGRTYRKDYARVSPLVVAYGGGVDSTAMLVGMARICRVAASMLKDARLVDEWRPDAITFADPGAEHPETYAFLEIMQE